MKMMAGTLFVALTFAASVGVIIYKRNTLH